DRQVGPESEAHPLRGFPESGGSASGGEFVRGAIRRSRSHADRGNAADLSVPRHRRVRADPAAGRASSSESAGLHAKSSSNIAGVEGPSEPPPAAGPETGGHH